jgi:TM2 domain-containing membrane protein YozV
MLNNTAAVGASGVAVLLMLWLLLWLAQLLVGKITWAALAAWQLGRHMAIYS